jgi:hypothetical protein
MYETEDDELPSALKGDVAGGEEHDASMKQRKSAAILRALN